MAYQLVYPELANALYLALKADGFYQQLEAAVDGDESRKNAAMLIYMDYSIVEAQEFGVCFIPEGQHYGVSIWSKPLPANMQTQKDQLKRNIIETHMGAGCLKDYLAMCEFMSSQAQPQIAADAWYLSIIGILPDFQGQGLGPGLLEPVIKQADKAGVASYLETFTPRNLTFYQRLGYQTLSVISEPTCQSEYWLMLRPPQ